MKCLMCNKINDNNAKYCYACGSKLGAICNKCGGQNLPNSLYCSNCGVSLKFLTDTSDLQNSFSSERKYVTVVFSDLSGYTSMTEKLDPEYVTTFINRVFHKISLVIEKYDGFIERYIGDSVMAVFGIPVSNEDDPVRAIRAAIEIHESVNSLSHWVENKINKKLSMHTGINTGLVVTGEIDKKRGMHGLTGFTINIASRLEGLSKPGEILVGYNTYRQAEREFNFEEMEPVNVKGKSEPLRVFKLISLKNKPENIPLHYDLKSRYIGKTKEIKTIIEMIDSLKKRGRGGIVSVTGDAGIGKSRLIAEVKDQVANEQLLWLEGRALSYGQTISYWPFLEVLKNFAGITDKHDEVIGWRKLQDKMVSLFPDEVADTLPYLATLLDMEVKGNFAERVEFLNGEAMKRQIFRMSRKLMERLALSNPLVLEFEDFHWADLSTVTLLEHILPLVDEVPILFFFVARPYSYSNTAKFNEKISTNYVNSSIQIHLSPLDKNECTQMVCDLLDIDDISSQMKDIIELKSQGNPLFLEELILTLINSGMVFKDKVSGKWIINEIKGKVPLPDTLRSLISSNIDRLDEDIRDILRVASVIGRSFLYRLLEAVKGARGELEDHLQELEEVNIIKKKNIAPELEYIFRHDLVKDSVYESILLEQRRYLHRKVGEAIEIVFSNHVDKFYGLLAYHYAQAADWGKAHEYLMKTGDQAARIAADSEALSHYKKAVSAYEKMFGNRWDPFQRAELERKIGEALFRHGEHNKAYKSLINALELLGDSFPKSIWGLRYGIVKNVMVQIVHRLFPMLLRKNQIDEVNETFIECMKIRELIAWIDYTSNNTRLVYNIINSLNINEKANYLPGIAQSLSGLGIILDACVKPRLAEKYHILASRSSKESNNPLSLAMSYYGYGMHLHFMNEKQQAIEMYENSAQIGKNIGNIKLWASPSMLKSILYFEEGDFDKSTQICSEVTDLGKEVSDEQIIGWGLHLQGKNLMYLKYLDKAEECIRASIELLKTVPDYFVLSFVMSDLARCCIFKDQEDIAKKTVDQLLELIEKYSIKGHCVWYAHSTCVEVCLAMCNKMNNYQQSKYDKIAKKLIKDLMRKRKVFQINIPKLYRLKGSLLWQHGKHKKAQKWWDASLNYCRYMENSFEEGLTCFEIGKYKSDDVFLDKSRSIFEQLGANIYLQ